AALLSRRPDRAGLHRSCRLQSDAAQADGTTIRLPRRRAARLTQQMKVAAYSLLSFTFERTGLYLTGDFGFYTNQAGRKHSQVVGSGIDTIPSGASSSGV